VIWIGKLVSFSNQSSARGRLNKSAARPVQTFINHFSTAASYISRPNAVAAELSPRLPARHCTCWSWLKTTRIYRLANDFTNAHPRQLRRPACAIWFLLRHYHHRTVRRMGDGVACSGWKPEACATGKDVWARIFACSARLAATWLHPSRLARNVVNEARASIVL
jgi:hypothetical protein